MSCNVWLTRQRRQAFKFDSKFQIYFMIYVNKIVLYEPNETFYSRIQFGSCLFLSDNGHFINVSIKFWNDFFCIMFFIFYMFCLNLDLQQFNSLIKNAFKISIPSSIKSKVMDTDNFLRNQNHKAIKILGTESDISNTVIPHKLLEISSK